MINGGRHIGKPHHNRMCMKRKLLTNFLHYYHILHLHIALPTIISDTFEIDFT